MVETSRVSLAVLISGRGSNMEAILKASQAPDYPARIVLVLSDNKNAKGLETARQAGIEAIGIERKDYTSKAGHEADIQKAIEACGADLVCLAGYMRILSAEFTRSLEGRLINIHPSLLPKFKGLDTHQRALDAGESEHGCTIHYVNAEMDGGEIIAQAKVPVLPGDDAQTLAERVLVEEHKLYPKVIAELANRFT